MKKAITLLTACLLVFGFAGMAAADVCVTCETDPGHIARGCEMGQDISCYPFDYEDFGICSGRFNGPASYCESGAKYDIHRALFKICDCITDGTFDGLSSGETVDVSMEILVDKGAGQLQGDNGVYWAEDVNTGGVGMQTFPTQTAACSYEACYPENYFGGDFIYKTASGAIGYPDLGNSCDLTDKERVIRFDADPTQTGEHGYTVTDTDDIDNNSVWWIDIPYLRVDPDMVEAGWKVYVKICLYKTLTQGGVCGECEGCCCVIYIGELCCESIQNYGSCVYPYFPPLNTPYWNTMGLAISNMDDQAGTATITVYEADGDVGTATVDLAANGIYLWQASTMVPQLTQIAGTGTLGDSMSYAVITGTVTLRGFCMIASSATGESIGYLPECCGSICSSNGISAE